MIAGGKEICRPPRLVMLSQKRGGFFRYNKGTTLSHLKRGADGATGAQIIFRGLDDPSKLKSIKPTRGVFRFVLFSAVARPPASIMLKASKAPSTMKTGRLSSQAVVLLRYSFGNTAFFSSAICANMSACSVFVAWKRRENGAKRLWMRRIA